MCGGPDGTDTGGEPEGLEHRQMGMAGDRAVEIDQTVIDGGGYAVLDGELLDRIFEGRVGGVVGDGRAWLAHVSIHRVVSMWSVGRPSR